VKKAKANVIVSLLFERLYECVLPHLPLEISPGKADWSRQFSHVLSREASVVKDLLEFSRLINILTNRIVNVYWREEE